MFRPDVKLLGMFAAILFFGRYWPILAKKSACDCSEYLLYQVNARKACLYVLRNKVNADCLNRSSVMDANESNCSLIVDEHTLSEQDIFLLRVPHHDEEYTPPAGVLYHIHRCLKTGNTSINQSVNSLCEKNPSYDEDACRGLAETQYKFTASDQTSRCVSCKAPGRKPDLAIDVPPPDGASGTGVSPGDAATIMQNLSYFLEEMGNCSTASVTMGGIKGLISKLLLGDEADFNFGVTSSGDFNILEDDSFVSSFSRSVHIPAEACAMAVERNGSFAGVLVFPTMYQDDPESFFLNDEFLGIEMGTEISNLSHTVDIHYRRVDTNGRIASCRSWDGKEPAIWTTDGCRTRETRGGGGVTCQCSHLTFFAILMSPPAVNMSASDVRSLTQITSMGCGLSMLFLAGAVFVHCLKFRKEDTSQATEILMNLFAAMFALNLSFLVNESVAALGHSGACVAMAAVMHYAMLATCTWFFTEALHLHLVLRKLSTGRRYMAGIYVTGWAPPAVVVITLLALGQYDHVVLHTDDGSSAKICWISDAVVHNGVNVGYYAAVFLFAFAAFIATVRQIAFTRPAAGKRQNVCSTNSFSIVGLLLLLGITWAFAFFSHGPLLIASYYIFTILNSFQGFFLFVYYICSRRKSSSPWDTSSAPTDAVTHSH